MATEQKIVLSTENVCSIIEACATRGVSVLKFGPLHLVFGKQVEPSPMPAALEPTSTEPNPVKAITDQQHKSMTLEAVEAEEVSLMDDRVAAMVIDNPEQLEKLIRDGELEDDDEPRDE